MAYGEWFPKLTKGDVVENGDVITYEKKGSNYGVMKAYPDAQNIIGIADVDSVIANPKNPGNVIHLDNYGNPIEFSSDMERWKYGHIPVALCGIVKVKFIGESSVGKYVTMSEIQGVARMVKDEEDNVVKFGKIINDILPDEQDHNVVRYVDIILIDNESLKGSPDIQKRLMELDDIKAWTKNELKKVQESLMTKIMELSETINYFIMSQLASGVNNPPEDDYPDIELPPLPEDEDIPPIDLGDIELPPLPDDEDIPPMDFDFSMMMPSSGGNK